MSETFQRVAIIGVGLIGSSIAHACGPSRVILWDADEDVRRRAAGLGLGPVAASAAEAAAGADLVVLATPVGAMGAVAAEIGPFLTPGAVVTDVGSVKAAVIAAAAPHVPAHVSFVPSHPIAGTEHSGPEAGFATLFENRWTLLTPLADPRPEYVAATEKLAAWWRGFGAQVDQMSAERHDLILAMTSHLPHLIAFNIVATAEDLETITESEVVKYSAGGFRDFTRIAASDPVMWRDVFLANREAVLEILARFSEELAAMQRAIRWGDGDKIHDTIARARRVRREVIEAGQDSAAPNFGRDKR